MSFLQTLVTLESALRVDLCTNPNYRFKQKRFRAEDPFTEPFPHNPNISMIKTVRTIHALPRFASDDRSVDPSKRLFLYPWTYHAHAGATSDSVHFLRSRIQVPARQLVWFISCMGSITCNRHTKSTGRQGDLVLVTLVEPSLTLNQALLYALSKSKAANLNM